MIKKLPVVLACIIPFHASAEADYTSKNKDVIDNNLSTIYLTALAAQDCASSREGYLTTRVTKQQADISISNAKLYSDFLIENGTPSKYIKDILDDVNFAYNEPKLMGRIMLEFEMPSNDPFANALSGGEKGRAIAQALGGIYAGPGVSAAHIFSSPENNEACLKVSKKISTINIDLRKIKNNNHSISEKVLKEPTKKSDIDNLDKPQPSSSLKNQYSSSIPGIAEKNYPEARSILLAAGWQPYRTHSPRDIDESLFGLEKFVWSNGYVEVESCAGTGVAPCKFIFIDPTGRQLEVFTEGEEIDTAKVTRFNIKN